MQKQPTTYVRYPLCDELDVFHHWAALGVAVAVAVAVANEDGLFNFAIIVIHHL